ncbi:UDP-N-acetylmuramoyl-tripeptide--D-alanyl-D-alanine ligase [Halomicronema sp. CCY15110]|uniref:UDP-N-acetylmuramoyl-tripeptide--D-alanyl-D- alanine ligase n=1 Tax=Halomicronema sp. CCY15110 TaxID=2767773 RepID=UPI001EF36E57|nr:UDP-N-acetylmuramoyl-tripeptide--D-alanyl-D-alanine ligase [Halomicronema sp. CCY15110]
MAFQIALSDLVAVTGGTLVDNAGELALSAKFGISTDTRQISPQDWFLALTGDRFNGHTFVAQAIAQGAAGVMVQEPVEGQPRLQVADTLAAYQAIARWWRRQLATPLVAVTGSVGKTTTKELIAAALQTQGPVLKTQANYNNEIGVPKTLLALTPEHRYGVIEMGMRGTGQIDQLTQIAEPDVAVITNVGTAHIELLGSEQAIADAKCELFGGLSPDGIAVLNYDNVRLMQTAGLAWSGQQITYGLTGGDVQGKLLNSHEIQVNGVTLPLPLPGQHNAVNFLAAIAVMQAFDLDWQVLQSGLPVTLPSGRAQRIVLPNDIELLDETYNAGAESMQAALHLLKQTPGQRHIAVLGTMKELGDHSVRLHEQVGKCVAQLELDALLTLADPAETQALAHGASGVSMETFDAAPQLVERLKAMLQPGDRVLFKASRAIALDQVVDAVTQALTPQEASAGVTESP